MSETLKQVHSREKVAEWIKRVIDKTRADRVSTGEGLWRVSRTAA